MSHTVRNKIKGTPFHVPSLVAALERMGLTLGVDFHVSEKFDHSIVDFQGRVKTYEAPVQVWIERSAVRKAAGTSMGQSNEIGFRADEDGNLEIVNNEHDSKYNFTPPVVKKMTEFVKVEGLKIEAKKKGYKKFVERRIKGKLKLFAQ